MGVPIKRVIYCLILGLFLSLGFFGCKKKVSFPNCKRDSDCRVDAQGNPRDGVCFMNMCEECVEDSHCGDNKQCMNNRCEFVCSADADCPGNKHCEDSSCVADCLTNSECYGGRVCSRGRCLTSNMIEQNNLYGQQIDECRGIERIHFDFDRFSVDPKNYENLNKLARCLEQDRKKTVVIEGHCDEQGTPAYNRILGRKRATATAEYLRQKGIASHRVTTVTYGEGRPLVQGKNIDAYAKNRRAEFVLQNR